MHEFHPILSVFSLHSYIWGTAFFPTACNQAIRESYAPEWVATEAARSILVIRSVERVRPNLTWHSSMFDRRRLTAPRQGHVNMHRCSINFDIVDGKIVQAQNAAVYQSKKKKNQTKPTSFNHAFDARNIDFPWNLHWLVDLNLLANTKGFYMGHLDMDRLDYGRHAEISVCGRKYRIKYTCNRSRKATIEAITKDYIQHVRISAPLLWKWATQQKHHRKIR